MSATDIYIILGIGTLIGVIAYGLGILMQSLEKRNEMDNRR